MLCWKLAPTLYLLYFYTFISDISPCSCFMTSASGVHDVSPRKAGVHPSVWLLRLVSFFLISMQSMVSTRPTMSGVCRASIFVSALVFCGVFLTTEAQTPSPAPGKFLFFFLLLLLLVGFSCCALFCPARVRSGDCHMTWAKMDFL